MNDNPYGFDVECLYPNKDGKRVIGQLNNVVSLSSQIHAENFISPLFRAKLYNGELPKNCEFMAELSEKLRKGAD